MDSAHNFKNVMAQVLAVHQISLYLRFESTEYFFSMENLVQNQLFPFPARKKKTLVEKNN